MRKAVERYLSGKGSEVEKAIMESRPNEWLGELMTIYLEISEQIEEYLTSAHQEQERLQSLGRDGRRLRRIAEDQALLKYSAMSRKKLSVERAIETVHKHLALQVGDERYRSLVVELLLEEIRIHKETVGRSDDPADARLWTLIGGGES